MVVPKVGLESVKVIIMPRCPRHTLVLVVSAVSEHLELIVGGLSVGRLGELHMEGGKGVSCKLEREKDQNQAISDLHALVEPRFPPNKMPFAPLHAKTGHVPRDFALVS